MVSSLVGIVASTAFTAVILCLHQLIQPCGAYIEIPGGICGSDYQDGSYVGCDTGRCCSKYGYCGSDSDHCVKYCWKQCHPVNGISGYRLHNISTHTNVVNATHNEYTKKTIDGWDGDRLVNASSCATSLSKVPPAKRNKYALAAFRPRNHTVTYCGQCLKLTNLETGVEAKVRVVHERNTEGLELDRDTFYKLGSDDPGSADEDDHHDDHLVLKYQFENCED